MNKHLWLISFYVQISHVGNVDIQEAKMNASDIIPIITTPTHSYNITDKCKTDS